MNFKQQLNTFITNAIAEDLGDGDHTSLATIPEDKIAIAQLLVKDDGILAGVTVAIQIFNTIDTSFQLDLFKKDGEIVKKGDIVLSIKGNARKILLAERLVLNTMQRMSGIATTTYRIVQHIQTTKTRILDTRKTTPNFRFLEKLAVKIGGGENHRFGLYDMILIKDNHIDTAGGIQKALTNTYAYLQQKQKNIPVEIEVRNFDELQDVLNFGKIDRILLDNFSCSDLKIAVSMIQNRFQTEASGNITTNNVLEYAQTGVDYISMGWLTHSITSLDLSLKIKLQE